MVVTLCLFLYSPWQCRGDYAFSFKTTQKWCSGKGAVALRFEFGQSGYKVLNVIVICFVFNWSTLNTRRFNLIPSRTRISINSAVNWKVSNISHFTLSDLYRILTDGATCLLIPKTRFWTYSKLTFATYANFMAVLLIFLLQASCILQYIFLSTLVLCNIVYVYQGTMYTPNHKHHNKK